MTKYEVLLCIYYYLDKQYFSDKNKSEAYIDYISNLNPDIWLDEGTADPAYYEIYLKICRDFFPGNTCSVQEGLQHAGRYLREYNVYEHVQFSSDIDEVVKIFAECTLHEWTEIYKWVKEERNHKRS